MKARYIALAAPLALLGTVLVSGTAKASVPYHHTNSVNQRLRDQHTRIHQGVGSGQLTWRETHNLDVRDARVQRQERRDRFFHHGRLTSAERRHLNSELNHDSRTIYRDKHNRRVR